MSTHPASIPIDQLLKQCTISKGRSQGPGGQHRNKVSTHITITHTPTSTTAQAGERRSAAENEKVAISRLRHTLALTIRNAVPLGDARSDLWKSRCKNNKIVACKHDPSKAALRLECTSSQLLKLLTAHPPAMVLLNKNRAEHRMHPLKH